MHPHASPKPATRRYLSSTADVLQGMVAEGVGAAVVPALVIQKGVYPNIRILALTPAVTWTLLLVSRRNAHLSPGAQALYDLLMRDARSNSHS